MTAFENARKFFDDIVVKHTDADVWHLFFEVRCESRAGEVFYIPAGFETDFASIPRPIWHILPPAGKWAKAAILHDWLYDQRIFPRKKCDDLFLEALLDTGVPKWLSHIMYRAVRAFGESVYRS